jgi:F-type H+-transporting ATPase subunit delta
MSIARIANRYAHALYQIAQEAQKADKIFADTEYLKDLCDHKEFKLFLKSPIISVEKKQNVFTALVSDKVSPETLRTLLVIAEHKREAFLKEICLEFQEMYYKNHNTSKARLVTAHPISDAQAESILAEFKQKQFLATNVLLTREVNTELIGGFVIYFRDQVYDASVQYKLSQLENLFSENLYIKNF